MLRWFENDDDKADINLSRTQKEQFSGRQHTFRVLVNQHLEPGDRIAITGDCKALGSWLPARCVLLSRESGK